MTVPKLVTVGVIAAELGEPLHRVVHVLRTRATICPRARAGTLRLYARDVIDDVRRELAEIDARRNTARRRPFLALVTAEPRP